MPPEDIYVEHAHNDMLDALALNYALNIDYDSENGYYHKKLMKAMGVPAEHIVVDVKVKLKLLNRYQILKGEC